MGSPKFRAVALGGPEVRRFRTDIANPTSAAEIHTNKDHPSASLLDLKWKLKAVLDVLGGLGRNGFTLSRGVDLQTQ